MTTIQVRPARAADVPDVERVVRRAFAPFTARTGIVPAPRSTDWPTVVSALGAVVALAGDRLVGVLVLWPHPDHLRIDTLAVDPEAQGTGVGTALLGDADRVADGRPLRLSTNAGMAEARAWYLRHGFVEVGRWTEDGYDRVHLER